jgi:hypothetical protein
VSTKQGLGDIVSASELRIHCNEVNMLNNILHAGLLLLPAADLPGAALHRDTTRPAATTAGTCCRFLIYQHLA